MSDHLGRVEPRRIGIIADDLTGAMDTGLQFSKRGLHVLVSLDWQEFPDAEVVVVDTESRAIQASQAHRRVRGVAKALAGWTIYKKVDSTMRGNIGHELRALWEVLHPRCVAVCPAFPGSRRAVVGGSLLVDSQRLDQTYFAHDPRWPMREAHLPALLMQQSGMAVAAIGLADVVAGADHLTRALQEVREPLVVVDAVEASHLAALADALAALGPGWIPCGSAGLAEAWGQALGLGHPRRSHPLAPDERPALVVAGSRNDVTRAQLDRAREARSVARVDLDASGLSDAPREARRLVEACAAVVGTGRDAILTATFAPLVSGAGEIVAQLLADAAADIAARCDLAGLFVTGGDVAIAVCRALGVTALRIEDEIQAGIPGGRLVGGTCAGMRVVTKAGGFGDPRAVLDALDYLHGRTSSAIT